jgi:type IV secretory pathway VirB2 component (pilin)
MQGHPMPRQPVFRSLATVGLLLLVLFALAPSLAHAADIQVPFIQDFGCSIVQWLKGPLAILIFVLVCVATLVIGMITKMDWARIITVCVLFGVVIGLGSILSSSNYIQNVAGMSACLQ